MKQHLRYSFIIVCLLLAGVMGCAKKELSQNRFILLFTEKNIPTQSGAVSIEVWGDKLTEQQIVCFTRGYGSRSCVVETVVVQRDNQ